MVKLLLRAKLSHKLYSEVHMTIITRWFKLTKRNTDYKKSPLQFLNWKWILTKRNRSEITVMNEKEYGNRLSFAWKFWDILTFKRKRLTATCACGSSDEMGLKENPLIPPPRASNPKLSSDPLELGCKQFLFPELFKSIRKYVRRDHRCHAEWWQVYQLPKRWYVSRLAQRVMEMILRWTETYFPASQGPDLGVLLSSFFGL